MNLHLENEGFRELIELAADHFGYEQSHIEKDYWVCKILKELALSDFAENIYFKGGTSLSKAYSIIDRFSEDLDMFAYSGNPTSSKQAEKTLNRNISHFVIENNAEMYKEELSKTGGDFRKLAFSYDTHYESAGLKENLEVEIKCCTLDNKSKMYYPAQRRQITPIVTEYLLVMENEELIARFALNGFEVQTIDPKRTLCDKISRLTRLSYNDDFEILIAKHIRDIYDIYRLLSIPDYANFIQSDEFIEALKLITDEDGLYRNSQSHNPISKANIYAQTEEVLQFPAISRAYHEELRKLIFDADKMPTLIEVAHTITLLRKPLQQFDEKRISTL